jgi:hypothetical protein
MFDLVKIDGVGEYFRDKQASRDYWATFRSVNWTATCATCGKTIDGGLLRHRGKLGVEHHCIEHANIQR